MLCTENNHTHKENTRTCSVEAMEDSQPLHLYHVQKSSSIINRSYALLHLPALTALIYYRISHIFQNDTKTSDTPVLPLLLVFASELILSFLWLLNQACRFRPVSRTVFPERLPEDDKLPAIDVFICTADPDKEPTVEVMNTVLSAMALDYPPEKLHVYLSDDAGAKVTLHGMREAWGFARWWLPFCRTYKVETRCPEAYFSASEDDLGECTEFLVERQKIKEKYELFKQRVTRARENGGIGERNINNSRDHPAVVEVIHDNAIGEINRSDEMPLLVYVSREKRPSHAHHFKAGALNVLLRVSNMMSNSPYILVLDCDMYCNDPSSARRALCFHLDPKISPSLAFVQYPQRFHNIVENDLYDGQLRSVFQVGWHGLDGLKGPILSGTGFYIKREALYGNSMHKDIGLMELQQVFGTSNEFIKTLHRNFNPKLNAVDSGRNTSSAVLAQETPLLASCTYEDHTKWGKEVGFMYHSVVEDYFTGFILHCKGWTSIYYNPKRPQFLGNATTTLNDLLVQGMRWSSGLAEVGISRFCPLIYGPLRMSILQSMCYADLAFLPFFCLPIWCFATIPPLCLLNGLPLYPKVSSPFFIIIAFIFLSSLIKHLQEVIVTGGSIKIWRNEQQMWMIKSITCHLYGTMDAIMKRIGIREASFFPTNKVMDDEQNKLYQMGKLDFQTSIMFLVPLVSLVILNAVSLIGGIARMIFESDNFDIMGAQVVLSIFILIMSYPIIEGMLIRKDKGRIPLYITLLSSLFSMIILFFGSIVVTL